MNQTIRLPTQSGDTLTIERGDELTHMRCGDWMRLFENDCLAAGMDDPTYTLRALSLSGDVMTWAPEGDLHFRMTCGKWSELVRAEDMVNSTGEQHDR